MHADLIFTNGRLLTLASRPARALAVLGDRIIGVGEDDLVIVGGRLRYRRAG